jgi:hypothetical protein
MSEPSIRRPLSLVLASSVATLLVAAGLGSVVTRDNNPRDITPEVVADVNAVPSTSR